MYNLDNPRSFIRYRYKWYDGNDGIRTIIDVQEINNEICLIIEFENNAHKESFFFTSFKYGLKYKEIMLLEKNMEDEEML
jgi:hypothetical protein